MRYLQALKRKSGSSLSVVLTGNVGIVVLNSVSGILIARLLGPEGRGEFVAAVAWAAIIGILVQLAVPYALTYFIAHSPQNIGDIFVTSCLIWSVQSIIALVLGQILVGVILSQSQALESIRLYLLSVPFTMALSYVGNMAGGLKRFKMLSVLRLCGALAYVATAGVGSIFLIDHAFTLIVFMLLFQIGIAISGILAFYRIVRPSGQPRWSVARDLLRYGFKTYWGSLSWMANSRLDQFLMSAVVTLDQLGQYSVAVAYSGILFPVSLAFAIVLFPSVSSVSFEEGKRAIWRALKRNLGVTIVGAIGLGIASPLLIPFLFGEEFASAIPVAIVLLFGTIFLGSNYVLSDGFRGLGLPLLPSIAEVVGTVITVVGLLVLLPLLGIMGAAYVSTASYACSMAILLIFLSYREFMSRIKTLVV